MAAFTFGNVHGAYKPGVVKLRPELLDEIQTTVALAIKAGEMPDPAHSLDVAPGKPFALVFHGGSGSAPEEIAQAVSYGVVRCEHRHRYAVRIQPCGGRSHVLQL